MTAVLRDDTELFRQSSNNPGFKEWLTDTVFGLTYDVISNPAHYA
jgi:type I restriction enzyme, R subunit